MRGGGVEVSPRRWVHARYLHMTSLCLVTGPSFSPVVVDVSGQQLSGTSCNSSSLYNGQLPPHTLCVATDCQVTVCQCHISNVKHLMFL